MKMRNQIKQNLLHKIIVEHGSDIRDLEDRTLQWVLSVIKKSEFYFTLFKT